MIFVSVAYWVTNDGVQIVAIIASMLGGMACFGAAIGCCVTAASNPETSVENELKAAMKTTQQT